MPTDYARRVIQRESLRLCRGLGLGPNDREDIAQELWVAVFGAIDRHDPARASLDTFIDRVVQSAAVAIRRRLRRRKRAPDRPVVSLDGDVTGASAPEDDMPTSLGATVSASDQSRLTGHEPRDASADMEAAEAVEIALSLMPDDVREIARRLMGGTVASVARDMGVSRQTIRRACRDIRAYIERVGIGRRQQA